MKKAIIGISAYYHDSAACVLIDGKLVAAVQEERFTRIKHDPSFPTHALKFILDNFIDSDTSIEAIAYYEKPYLKFERLLETYHAFAPVGLKSYLRSIPVWIKQKLFLKKELSQQLANLGIAKVKLYFTEHHLSHAASAFFPSPFHQAAILTVDGVGEWATTTISVGDGSSIKVLKELTFPHSLGLLYSSFTWYCGFRVNSGEYKLMGLAPFGNNDANTQRLVSLIRDELVDIKEDGSFLLNMRYFDFATGKTMTKDKKWETLFGLPRRKEDEEITQQHMNIALAIQTVTNEIMLKLAATAKKITNSSNLVMAGGVALNCVSNGVLEAAGIFEHMWIQPAAGDAGGCLGAAWMAHYSTTTNERVTTVPDSMNGMLLGPRYDDHDISKVIRKHNAVADHYPSAESLTSRVAQLISEGNVIGWFQGRSEFGPRALGNRSILADPRNEAMQRKLNLNIKFRESFRPFAPIVLEEDLGDYFSETTPSPYMMFVRKLKKELCYVAPEGHSEFDLAKKLYTLRSPVPAITHVDYSARLQSVTKESNYLMWQLITTFKSLTQTAMLINTSFNVRGEPIVNTPGEALECFMNTDMDYLVMGNFLLDKKEQKSISIKKELRQFGLD